MNRDALLVLADGAEFEGEAIGADVPSTTGEVVFNTGCPATRRSSPTRRTRGR